MLFPLLYSIPISSVFSSLSFQRIIMFKIMNAVRVDTRVVSKQEKGGFVISDSVSAIQCQQYTHITFTPLCTMSLRHQSRDWKGESEEDGGREIKKRMRKKDRKKRQTPKYLFLWKCMVSLQQVIYIYTEWLTAENTSLFSFKASKPFKSSQSKVVCNKKSACSRTLMALP